MSSNHPTTRSEIFDAIIRTMSETFEMDADDIKPDSHLFEDLGLDSIDAIDMAAKMQDITGHRIEESSLRKLQTVDDVVNLAERLIRER